MLIRVTILKRVGLAETVQQATLFRNLEAGGLGNGGMVSIAMAEGVMVILWSSHSILWNNYGHLLAHIVSISLSTRAHKPSAVNGCMNAGLAIGADVAEATVAMGVAGSSIEMTAYLSRSFSHSLHFRRC